MSVTLAEGIDSVVLPDPAFGDTDEVNFNRSVSRNRSGEPLITHDVDRPIFETTEYLFQRLTSSEKSDLNDFLISKAGLEITLTDHTGRVKTGVILNPRITSVTIRDACSYEASFEFWEDIS